MQILACLSDLKWLVLGLWGGNFVVVHLETKEEVDRLMREMEFVIVVIDPFGNVFSWEEVVKGMVVVEEKPLN